MKFSVVGGGWKHPEGVKFVTRLESCDVLDLEFHNFTLLKGVRLAGPENFVASFPTSKEFCISYPKCYCRGWKVSQRETSSTFHVEARMLL